PLETALLIIPPPEVQIFATPLMEKYAPDRLLAGPAHITLFYPFFSFSEIDHAVLELQKVCAQCAPLSITLDHYERFPSICYMAPADPEPILELFRRIQFAFPNILPFGGKFGSELTPHLTLAECENLDKVVLPPAPSFSFAIDRIFLYYGYPVRSAWVPYQSIPLLGQSSE
ncbi:MAG: 2'-5' RNA ligase family protein, partial [Anaerolineales bacterium]|nr:2'-5' RNA ligase family protein [Anaerolineales bacterium]